MKLKNLNLNSDNITIFAVVYDDVFLVKCNRSTFQEIKYCHFEVQKLTVSANNDVHIYSSKNYNVRFVMKAFDTGLTVLNAKAEEITKDDFVNYLND